MPAFNPGEQTERAFQKQDAVFCATRRVLKSKFLKNSKGGLRYWKNVGLGFKTPKEAIEGTYVDKKCPFTGNVSIRGRILRGIVRSQKMNRTIIIRRNYLHWVTKYQRYEKRHKNFAAHCSPAFPVTKVGDEVVVGECRPLSKTVRFNVLKINPKGKARIDAKFKKFERY
eukprot:TRINITY_DN744_c0_g1_i1.p2 TRINITY_DN744_c0_g1~~TRINITY_DN744_c0_g1_i1.p2  ORF type:complete len:170 (+),score=77.41 TRINITY_DN744_c0_g1_i1:108-617(+)